VTGFNNLPVRTYELSASAQSRPGRASFRKRRDTRVQSVTTASRNFLLPSNPVFNNFGAFLSSNPRTIQVVGRFSF